MTHPSRLTLDLALIGAAPAADAAHIAACARCHAALAALDEERQVFLEAHPTPPPRTTERATPAARSASEPRSTRRTLRAALAITAAAAAIIALAFVVRPPDKKTARMKGATQAELWIKRSTETFAFDGRPLQQGDTLVFRYTTERKHLTVIDAEASGKIEVVIDQAIEPGSNRTAPNGVALDNYTGEERVIAFFSDAPLDVEKLRADPDTQPPNTDRAAWRIDRSTP